MFQLCSVFFVCLMSFISQTESVSIENALQSMNVSKLLDLSNQNIDSIENGTFRNASFIQVGYLYLSWNKLVSLNESDFAGLNNLVKVSEHLYRIMFAQNLRK
jgi:hypothetical protein